MIIKDWKNFFISMKYFLKLILSRKQEKKNPQQLAQKERITNSARNTNGFFQKEDFIEDITESLLESL